MRLYLLAAFALLLGCSAAQHPDSPTRTALPAVSSPGPRGFDPIDAQSTYLQANTKDVDGTPAFIHFGPEGMPLRISIEPPRVAARYASREETRQAVVDGIRLWETALQGELPWFQLEFVEDDADAPVQVVWRRRIPGDIAGTGGISWQRRNGEFRILGKMRFTGQTCPGIECRLTADELRYLVAHEFGHVLGLLHCLDCDSAMNYSWHTLGRVIVTDVDVRTLRALVDQGNGMRVDGRPLSVLRQEGD